MTKEELIELISSGSGVENISADEVGKILNPSSRKLSGFEKFLDNAAPLHGLFGQDSEKLGNDFLKTVMGNEIASGLEAKRADQKKQKDIMSLFDLDKSGSVGAGELPLSQQSRLRSEGQFPTKQEDISSQVLGPTRSLFQDVMKTDESGGLIPDEFGGAFGSKRGIGPSEIGKKALGSPQGADLLSALVGGDQIGHSTDPQGRQGVEQIARQFDPSLQASQEVEDPNAPLSDAVLNQSFDAVNTDLRTPRSHGQPETIDKATLGTSLAAIMMQTGASESEVLATMDVLPDNVPVSFANQMLSQVAGARGETAKINAKAAQNKEVQDRLDARQQDRYKLITNLKDHTAVLNFNNSAGLKVMGYQFATQLQSGAFGEKKKLEFEKDQRRFAHDIEMFSKKEALTKEEAQFKFGAQAVLQTMRGEAALNMETVRQGHRLALQSAGPNASNKDVLKEFVTDFMKSSPQVAEQFVDLIANTPPGQDPFMIATTREAMADLYKEIEDSDTAFEVVRVAQGTDIAADTLKEKTAWLQSEMNRLGAGQPSLGVPPMAPDQLKIIQNQIDFNKELMEAGGQSITIMGDEKPLLPEQAGKIADVYLNQGEVKRVQSDLFNDDGSVDRLTLQTMQEISLLPSFFPGGGVSFSGLPFTKGREVSQRLYRVIDTIVRAKTGAAMPEHEWPFYRALFFPSTLDSADGVRNKFERLEQWHDVFLSLVDPRGARRTMLGSGKPQQSLKSPSQQKPRKQVIRELLDSGVQQGDIPKALEGMGY